MRESANLCENRSLFYRSDVNAPFTTTLGFPPMFGTRSVKTKRLYSESVHG